MPSNNVVLDDRTADGGRPLVDFVSEMVFETPGRVDKTGLYKRLIEQGHDPKQVEQVIDELADLIYVFIDELLDFRTTKLPRATRHLDKWEDRHTKEGINIAQFIAEMISSVIRKKEEDL